MQLSLSRSNLIEKILCDKNGRLVRATFCVYECGGRMKAKLVDVVYLDQNVTIENKIPILSGFCGVKSFGAEIIFEKGIVSPYTDFNLLYSSGSKPRAPTQ